MAKRIGALDRIEEEHEADESTIDGRWGIAFGEQVVSVGFGIGWRDFGGFEARMFLLQLGGKAASILGIERDGFSREVWSQVQLLLPDGNLIPYNVSLLSAQLHYRRSFFGDNCANSADNIPHLGRN